MNELTHPILVHLPLGLMFILPVLIIMAFVSRGEEKKSWISVIITAFLIALFSYLAVYTGEMGEHILEEKINHDALEEHEEAGEFFALLSYTMLGLVTIVFFLKGKLRKLGSVASLLLACFLIFAGYRAGSHGGDLVYKYGAAELLKNKAESQSDHDARPD